MARYHWWKAGCNWSLLVTHGHLWHELSLMSPFLNRCSRGTSHQRHSPASLIPERQRIKETSTYPYNRNPYNYSHILSIKLSPLILLPSHSRRPRTRPLALGPLHLALPPVNYAPSLPAIPPPISPLPLKLLLPLILQEPPPERHRRHPPRHPLVNPEPTRPHPAPTPQATHAPRISLCTPIRRRSAFHHRRRDTDWTVLSGRANLDGEVGMHCCEGEAEG